MSNFQSKLTFNTTDKLESLTIAKLLAFYKKISKETAQEKKSSQ
jgi:hypothetical protein